MNYCLRTLACVLFLGGSVYAVELFPKQPALRKAHHKLMSAKANLGRSQQGRPLIHLNEASVDLSAAYSLLENAKKNKGSSRVAAMKAIEAAQAEIPKLKAKTAETATAIQHVDVALKEVAESARAGR